MRWGKADLGTEGARKRASFQLHLLFIVDLISMVLVSNTNKYSWLPRASDCSNSHDVDWLMCETRVGESARERPRGTSQHCARS